jgi:hypothetical protein
MHEPAGILHFLHLAIEPWQPPWDTLGGVTMHVRIVEAVISARSYTQAKLIFTHGLIVTWRPGAPMLMVFVS